MSADLIAVDRGTIAQIFPQSEDGQKWLDDNVYYESWQWFGGALCIEPRCAVDILEAASADWLEVRML